MKVIFKTILSSSERKSWQLSCGRPRVSTISAWSAWLQLALFHALSPPSVPSVRVHILLGKGETYCLQGDLLLICLALKSVIKKLWVYSSLSSFLAHCFSSSAHKVLGSYKGCCFSQLSSLLTVHNLTFKVCLICLWSVLNQLQNF